MSNLSYQFEEYEFCGYIHHCANFTIDSREYFIAFTPLDEETFSQKIDNKIPFTSNSYEINFDLIANYQQKPFQPFESPATKWLSIKSMRQLDETLFDLIRTHCYHHRVNKYYFIPSDEKLKHYYDRLIKKYAPMLNCSATYFDNANEECHYEITIYQSN